MLLGRGCCDPLISTSLAASRSLPDSLAASPRRPLASTVPQLQRRRRPSAKRWLCWSGKWRKLQSANAGRRRSAGALQLGTRSLLASAPPTDEGWLWKPAQLPAVRGCCASCRGGHKRRPDSPSGTRNLPHTSFTHLMLASLFVEVFLLYCSESFGKFEKRPCKTLFRRVLPS